MCRRQKPDLPVGCEWTERSLDVKGCGVVHTPMSTPSQHCYGGHEKEMEDDAFMNRTPGRLETYQAKVLRFPVVDLDFIDQCGNTGLITLTVVLKTLAGKKGLRGKGEGLLLCN